MGEVAVVPESVLKKQKRNDEWELAKKQEMAATKKKNAEKCKLIINNDQQYTQEYEDQAKELVRLKREARMKGGFYVNPQPKLLFIIRIRGINAMHPKIKSIMQLLRLDRYPNLKSVRELIYKRGYGKLNKKRTALTDNSIVEKLLSK